MVLDLYVSWSVHRWHFAMLSYLKTQTKMHSMIIHQFLKMNGERNVQQSWEGMYIMIYCIMITLLPRVIITEACFYLNYYENILSGNFQIIIDS